MKTINHQMRAAALITLVDFHGNYEEWFVSEDGEVLNATPDSSKYRIGSIFDPFEDLEQGDLIIIVDPKGKEVHTNLKITFIKQL